MSSLVTVSRPQSALRHKILRWAGDQSDFEWACLIQKWHGSGFTLHILSLTKKTSASLALSPDELERGP